MLQELKGNIRVFCRVRPLLSGENSSEEAKTISYPTSLEALGRGIDLMQNGMNKSSEKRSFFAKKKETHLLFALARAIALFYI